MTIKNIIKYVWMLPVLAMVACSEYKDDVVAGPAVDANCPAVRFNPNNTVSYELDPSGDPSFTITLMRDASSTEAIEAPIVATSNAEYFDIPATASFASGSQESTITVRANSQTPTGEALQLDIKVDDAYANPYKTEYATIRLSVALIKWNTLGKGQLFDSFVFTDTDFAVAAEVTIQQRDDKPTQYRFNSPYTTALLTAAGWSGLIGGATQPYILFTINATTDKVDWGFWYTKLLYQGVEGQEIRAYQPSVRNANNADTDEVIKDNAGEIEYISFNPEYYILGVGGYGVKATYLGFPGFDLAGALGVDLWVE